MLLFYNGKMLYSDALAWTLSVATPLVAILLAIVPHYRFLPPLFLAFLDRLLAFLALRGILLPFVRYAIAHLPYLLTPPVCIRPTLASAPSRSSALPLPRFSQSVRPLLQFQLVRRGAQRARPSVEFRTHHLRLSG